MLNFISFLFFYVKQEILLEYIWEKVEFYLVTTLFD